MGRTQWGDPADRDDGDVVEQRGRMFPSLKWRPPWGAVLAAGLAAGLVTGLAAGYAAGERQAGSSANPPRSSGTPALSGTAAQASTPALTQPGPECSAQIGRNLQLGVLVTNQSGTRLTEGHIAVVLPTGGLTPVARDWGPCGVLPEDQTSRGGQLPPGASAWFTVTFKVLVKCPSPLPVQFTVSYDQNGRPSSASLPGFPDLGPVPYADCPRASSSLRTGRRLGVGVDGEAGDDDRDPGQVVGLSAPATAERLRRLEDAGVVSYRAEVDPRALGYPICALVRISPDSPLGVTEPASRSAPA